jgi:TonB family protein
MKITTTALSSVVLASAMALAACNQPPAANVDASQPSVDTAAVEKARAEAAADARTMKARADARRARATAKARTANAARAAVSEVVTPPAKIKNVQPVYPALARDARIEGTVTLAVAVDADGKVSEARVLRSVPLLDQAALDAVRQWEYSPMRRGDRAVPTVMTVNVNFVRS